MAQRTPRQEIRKQLVDQPLHVAMGVASTLAVGSLLAWRRAPTCASAGIAVLVTAAWEGYREWSQWPSSRWWDPPLDWFFEIGGIALGVLVLLRWVVPANAHRW